MNLFVTESHVSNCFSSIRKTIVISPEFSYSSSIYSAHPDLSASAVDSHGSHVKLVLYNKILAK